MNKAVGLVATLLGVYAGGMMLTRVSLYSALLWFGILQAVSNLCFMFLAMVGHNYGMMIGAIFLENICGGMGTAAFIALLMGMCNRSYTATQFALFSALSAVGRVFVGPAAGYLVKYIGWEQFFMWTVLIALPGVLLLMALKSSIFEIDQGREALPDGKCLEE